MNFKKFISGVSAFAIAASAFAGMAVTASAATNYTWDIANATWDAPEAAGYIALKQGETAGTYVAALPDSMDTTTIYITVAAGSGAKSAGTDTFLMNTSNPIFYLSPYAGCVRINYKPNGSNPYKNSYLVTIGRRNSNGNYPTDASSRMPNDTGNYVGLAYYANPNTFRFGINKGAAYISTLTYKSGGSTTSKTEETLNDGNAYVSDENASDEGATYAKAYVANVTAGSTVGDDKDSYIVAAVYPKTANNYPMYYSGTIQGDAVVGVLALANDESLFKKVTIETYLK